MIDNAIPLFPGIPGGPEVLIVLFVLVLLFGANKIPKLARSTGEAMGEFKKGRQEIEEELKEGAGAETASGSETAPGESGTTTDSGAAADSGSTVESADDETERETT